LPPSNTRISQIPGKTGVFLEPLPGISSRTSSWIFRARESRKIQWDFPGNGSKSRVFRAGPPRGGGGAPRHVKHRRTRLREAVATVHRAGRRAGGPPRNETILSRAPRHFPKSPQWEIREIVFRVLQKNDSRKTRKMPSGFSGCLSISGTTKRTALTHE
jgi:hypothetical protein